MDGKFKKRKVYLFAILLVFVALASWLVKERVGFNFQDNTSQKEKAVMSSEVKEIIPEETEEVNDFAFSRKLEELTLEKKIPEKGRLIGVNLSTMELFLYEDGEVKESLSILSKGREGSFWETPSGLYDIKTKEENHFSSIGEVYMPYSMQFYGNFFIHGWPYYPNGTPVSSGYSGGCIRLSNEDSQKVFAFASIGTSIFIYEKEKGIPELSLKLSDVLPPKVTAISFLVADLKTGDVFVEKNANEVRPIASLTKLVTSLTANENVSFDRSVEVVESEIYQSKSDEGRFRKGDTFSIGNLLYPLLMESNNNIADSIAGYYGRSRFMEKMNEKAKAIGMKNSSFEDTSGLSSNNVSTAEDLYTLTKYLLDKSSFLLRISRTENKTVVSDLGNTYSINNFNHFSGDLSFVGGKTGYTTDAKETMISVFKIPYGSEEREVAIIVLGSDDRQKDTKALKDWLSSSVVLDDSYIKMGFVGDLMFDRGVEMSILKNGISLAGSRKTPTRFPPEYYSKLKLPWYYLNQPA